MDLFSKGILADNITTVGDYMKDNGVDISVLPNINMNNIQRIFYNKSATIDGFWQGISKSLKEYLNIFDSAQRHAYAKRLSNIKKLIGC